MATELTRVFSDEQYQQALESWGFLDLAGKSPMFTSPLGDVFFLAADGVWWLDTVEGTLSRLWATVDELNMALGTEAGQDEYLMAGLALGAEREGVLPAEGQVLGFKIPPVLGGPIEIANVEVSDFVVSLCIIGQIHDQIRGLQPGTKISGFTIDGALS